MFSAQMYFKETLFCDRSTGLEGAVLQRGLFLRKVELEDFWSNFTCIVTNAFGAAHKVIQLTKTSRCNQSRKPKTRSARLKA